MAFWVEMPKDKYFNNLSMWRVVEGEPRQGEYGLEVDVAEHDPYIPWGRTILADFHGWVQVEGPARQLEYEEYKALVADILNRDPGAGDKGMVTLRDGSRVPLMIARVCLISLRDLFKTDPIAFYELVTATRNPDHQFWPGVVDRIRERGFLDAEGRPAGSFRDVILNAVEGENEQMRLVNPEQPR